MHRFAIGQRIFVPWAGQAAPVPSGTYVVVRLLPPVGGEPHYRIKSTRDGQLRALLESQMRPVVIERTSKQPPEASPAQLGGTATPEGESIRRSDGKPATRAAAANHSTQPTKTRRRTV
jgi:hypothetical protein